MAAFLDVCRFNPTLGGTTDWTVSTAVTGYQTPASAGAVNGALYRYRAESADLLQWEIGYGLYTVAGTVLARTTVLFNSSGTTAKINFTLVPQVGVVALAEDLSVPFTPQGRLTLQTAVPVMVTAQTAKTTIFYTSYIGNQIPIYDGTYWAATQITGGEISVLTTDTTKSPAAIGVSKVNDWFIWNDAGTVRIGHGPDWTSDTVRSAGTALVMVNGILLNNASITNGPAASRGTYVGTTRSNASSQFDWVFGSLASGGSNGFFGLWNTYNRVDIKSFCGDTTTQWNYAVVSTWRAANASNNMRHTFIRGLDEDGISGDFTTAGSIATAAIAAVGIGLDSTTAFSGATSFTASANGTPMTAKYSGVPGLGVHFLQAIEFSTGATSTFYGNVTVYSQTGLHISLRM